MHVFDCWCFMAYSYIGEQVSEGGRRSETRMPNCSSVRARAHQTDQKGRKEIGKEGEGFIGNAKFHHRSGCGCSS